MFGRKWAGAQETVWSWKVTITHQGACRWRGCGHSGPGCGHNMNVLPVDFLQVTKREWENDKVC